MLVLVLTTPRVAPGLMSWAGWSAVSAADRRLASSLDSPLARAVVAAGHPVEQAEPSVPVLLEASASATVVWLADDAEAERLPRELGDVPVEVVHASYDVPGARLLDLVAVMDRLRLECPWDREQTHRSLAPYLLEETYETLEAIDNGDLVHLREELGDLLLQVYFHARVAAEDEVHGFTIDDVAAGIVDKLVHRHPHVFAGLEVADAAEVDRNWEALKAAEKGRTSVLDGIPVGLPALAWADKVLGRAARVGVVPDLSPTSGDGVSPGGGGAVSPGGGDAVSQGSGRVIEPSPERTGAVAPAPDTLGERLLALVVEARAAGSDAEQLLRETVRSFAATVRAAEPR